MASYLLGISCYYHDSAAALLEDGLVVGAVQEERFSRKKHDPGFPSQSIAYLLRERGITLRDVQAVVYYEKPFLTFERLIETHLEASPFGLRSFLASMPTWIKEKLFLQRNLTRELALLNAGPVPALKFSEHHLSHASSAFFPSPFEEAAVLCVDGVGEWATTSAWSGSGPNLTPLWEIHFPHSLGLFYSTLTAYLGFKVNSGEYKVMGLAPYGEPRFANLMLENLLHLNPDGSFSLNLDYFAFTKELQMYSPKLEDLLGRRARRPEELLDQFHMDVAASLQLVLERALIPLAKELRRQTSATRLCLSGGVALNCVANSKLLRESGFEDLWIQPSAGDAGGALGAALAYYHLAEKGERRVSSVDAQQGSYLGPQFLEAEVEDFLMQNKIPYQKLPREEVLQETSRFLEEGKVIGWFQGRMEFGPRALGHRSILADARRAELQKTLNLKIKYRESFRPFAPVVLEEDASEIFDFDRQSPYMLFVASVRSELRVPLTLADSSKFGIEKLNVVRSTYPAVTHVDYSARLQTVSRERNPILAELLDVFRKRTQSSVLVNTSFNVRGEPIVCTPEDAYLCFQRTEIDVLVLENFIVTKGSLPPTILDEGRRKEFELD